MIYFFGIQTSISIGSTTLIRTFVPLISSLILIPFQPGEQEVKNEQELKAMSAKALLSGKITSRSTANQNVVNLGICATFSDFVGKILSSMFDLP